MPVYLFMALVMLLVIAVFVYQNPAAVVVSFIGWQSPEIQLGIVLLLAVLTGALLMFILDTTRYFKIARTIKDLKNQNKKLDKKLQAYLDKEAASAAAKAEAAAAAEEDKIQG